MGCAVWQVAELTGSNGTHGELRHAVAQAESAHSHLHLATVERCDVLCGSSDVAVAAARRVGSLAICMDGVLDASAALAHAIRVVDGLRDHADESAADDASEGEAELKAEPADSGGGRSSAALAKAAAAAASLGTGEEVPMGGQLWPPSLAEVSSKKQLARATVGSMYESPRGSEPSVWPVSRAL